MSETENLEQIRRLPEAERRQLLERIEEEFGADDELTSDQIAELDRRAEEALKHPGRGTPWEQLRDEMLLKYRK